MIDEIDSLLTEEQPDRRGRLSMGSIILLIGVLMVVGTIGLALLRQNQSQPKSGDAPDFTVATFDGETFRLSDQRGKIVVINFWGSWCAPCRAEAPALQRVYERYRDKGVVILGITYLESSPQDSLDFIEEYGLTYPNAPDPRAEIAEKKYHIRGAPENFVIDQDGNIAYFHLGPVTEELLSDVLDGLLAEESV